MPQGGAGLGPLDQDNEQSDYGQNGGHGHVYPRPDGVYARCGGPALCTVCAADQVKVERDKVTDRLDRVPRAYGGV